MSHRFLIVRLGSLGDVIHAIPTAAALRARFPEARIDWLVDPRYVPLLEIVRGIDSRIPLNTRRVGQTVSTIRDLRRVAYTAVLDLQGLLKSALLARAVKAERTIGFDREHLRERMAAPFYSHRVVPAAGAHVIFKSLALLEPLGGREMQASFPLEIPHSAAADEARSRVGGEPYALINPGAAWPNKRWPAERFCALARRISDATGLRQFVLWGGSERPIADAVSAASQGAAEPAPETTLADLLALSRAAALMVSGDTGPVHIAAAVETPIVGLYGPTWPARNGPWHPDDEVVSRAETCVCHHKRQCQRPARCIDDITVDEVFAAVERRLRKAAMA